MGLYLVDYENVHDAGLEGVGKLNANDKVVVFYGIKIKAVPFDRHIELMNSKAQIEYIKTDKIAKNYLDFQLSTYLGYVIGTGEKGPVIIVSKDTGFDSLVDYWKDHNIKINRQLAILCKPEEASDNDKQSKSATKAKKTVKNPNKSKATNNSSKEIETEIIAVDDLKIKEPVKKEALKPDNKLINDVPESIRKKIRTAVKKEKLQASKYTAIYNAMAKAKNHSEYKQLLEAVFIDGTHESVYNHTQNVYGEYINKKNSTEE